MWSHYASNHEGICFGFDFQVAGQFLFGHWVRYAQDFPVLNYIETVANGLDYRPITIGALYTKSDQWSYEREWRVKSTPGVKVYPPGALTEITFGCRTSPQTIREVRKVVDQNDQRPVLFRARVVPGKFALDRVPL
jgi:hypothetical protein